MSGPLTEDARRLMPGAGDLRGPAAQSVSSFTGGFANPVLESEFRRDLWGEWSRRTRTVALIAAGFVLAFGYADYLTLGPGLPLAACLALRVLVLAAALGVWRIGRGERPRVAALDRAAQFLAMGLATALCVIFAILGRNLMFETPGAVLLVLGTYVFLPLPMLRLYAAGVYASTAFLATGVLFLPHTATDLFVVATELALCNVLGAYTALQSHRLRRREYLSVRRSRGHLAFEELLARFSTHFINLPADEVDAAVEVALAEIGEYAGSDRSYVIEFDRAGEVFNCRFEWARPGVSRERENLQGVPAAAFAWSNERLARGEVVHIPSVAALPEEAAGDRAAFLAQNIRSVIMVPMTVRGQLTGLIGFDAVRVERDWDVGLVLLLRMVGEMIANVLERQRSELELHRRQSELEASNAALEESNVELKKFAYVASHDLQEPLRGVSGFSSLLAKRYGTVLDATGQEYIQYVTRSAQRLQELIGDLVAYSGLDSREQPFIPCDTRALVEEAVGQLRDTAAELGAEVLIGDLPVVDGDRAQLVQLFHNLIGNALKFHGAQPPRVRVDARQDDAGWGFAVADNGIGIAPHHYRKLFRVFTRLHPVDQYPGSGIGLAVCKRIVERHRGRIWVEANRPQGTVFCFTLPAP